MVHLVKFIGKGCSIFFECLHYATLIVLQDIILNFIKYCMVPTWQYNNRTKLYNFLLVQNYWCASFCGCSTKSSLITCSCNTKIYLGKSRKLGPLSFLVVQITVMNTSIFVTNH